MPDDSLNESNLQDDFKSFLDANIAYYKLYLFKVLAKASATVLGLLLVIVFLLIALFFFSVALAISLGYLLNNMAIGFLILGFIYLLVTLVVYYRKDKIFEHSIIKKFADFF